MNEPDVDETLAESAPKLARVPEAPSSIGKYRLERVLGTGGMGVVWAALDPDLERAVAIKLLHADGDEPTLRTRLLREARAMARLKHPNVLTVYEVGTDTNRDFIAMELVDGGSLEEWLAMHPPQSEIVAALVGAGRGLAAAHAAGLVHRDFKPHNVLRSRDGHVYVTDFGLARGQLDPCEADGGEASELATAAIGDCASGAKRDSIFDVRLTRTGLLLGTPAYMAPEQLLGRLPDPRSDQFAFCVTAWEALTGERPFQGATLPALHDAVQAGLPATTVNDLPVATRDVLARGLAADPSRRWPDMHSLLDAFARSFEPAKATEAAPTPTTQRQRARRRWPAAVGAAVALVGAAVTIAIVMRDSTPPRRTIERSHGPTAATARSHGPAASTMGAAPGHNAPTIGDACDDPEAAFASAWSPDKRESLLRTRTDGEALGAVAILEDVRRQWLASYREACSAERTPQIRERLACLEDVRARATNVSNRIIARDLGVRMTDELTALAVRVMVCDPRAPGAGASIKETIERSLPMLPPPPPLPTPPAPTPPTPPAGPHD